MEAKKEEVFQVKEAIALNKLKMEINLWNLAAKLDQEELVNNHKRLNNQTKFNILKHRHSLDHLSRLMIPLEIKYKIEKLKATLNSNFVVFITKTNLYRDLD